MCAALRYTSLLKSCDCHIFRHRQRSADIRRNVGAALFDQKYHNFRMAALGRTAQRRPSPLMLRLDVGAGSQHQLPHINVPILCGFLPYCGTEKTTDLEGVQIHAYNIDLCCIKKDSSTISNRNCKSTAWGLWFTRSSNISWTRFTRGVTAVALT